MGGRSNTLNPLSPLAPDECGAGWMRRLPTKSHLKFQQLLLNPLKNQRGGWSCRRIGGRGTGDAAARSCQRFRPIAQTSSHELSPTLSPCVLQIQAMSHARSVIPSTNKAYATESSFATTESFFSMCSGRGLGRGCESTVLEAKELLFERNV